MSYIPSPKDTRDIILSDEIIELSEELAKNTHEVWAESRLKDGWTYGSERDDKRKKHPCLVPYESLPENEKDYDRKTSIETLKLITAMGYSITKKQNI